MYESLREHIIKGLNQGIRLDGRGLLNYRKISVEYDVSKSAEGSARVRIGETHVLAGVKMAIEEPYADSPDEGTIMVGTELTPMSNPEFEAGPPNIQSIELSRVVDRGIRESKAIDVKKLCIEHGQKVWVAMIDICTMNDMGNLFDAAALAAIAALKSTRFPKYDGTAIDYHEKTDKPLHLNMEPISVTVLKIGKHYIIDPLPDEEKVADARLTIASTEKGQICAMQKGGESAVTLEEIEKMVEIGIEKSKELRKYLNR